MQCVHTFLSTKTSFNVGVFVEGVMNHFMCVSKKRVFNSNMCGLLSKGDL